MTDKELAKEYVDKLYEEKVIKKDYDKDGSILYRSEDISDAFLAGLKAGKDTNVSTKWHKVADGDLPKGEKYGKNSIHRNIYLKDRYGNLYTGNYYPKDETHAEDCFAVEVLEWGFQGSQFCKRGQIAEWCEIPQYTEE